MLQFKYKAVDEFGDDMHKFYTLVEAKHFIHNKPGCKVEKLDFIPESILLANTLTEFTNKFGEPPF